jgi:hypothetical protein
MSGVAESVVVIDEVALSDRRKRLIDFNLAHPEPEASESTYSLRFQGWAVGRHMPAVALTINDGQGKHIDLPLTHRRDDIAALMPDVPWAAQCGFTGRIGALHLPRRFQLELTARLKDGTRALIGHVRGHRRRLPALEGGRFTPVALTTIGRSGSTWLTWLLAQHPEVLAYRTFDMEPKGLAYFAELIRTLSQPTSYHAALNGDVDNGSEWWAGFAPNRGQNWYESDPGTDRWLGTDYVESLVPFFGSRLDELVGCQARAEGKPDARMFVEKMAPTFFGQALWLELVPAMREVFLVRDPRDVACSIFAFQRKRQTKWFWGTDVWTDEEVIREPLGNDVGLLTHCWEQRAETGHLMRYEDLITDPHRALAAVFQHLGVDASAATVAGVVERAGRLDESRRASHVTSADATHSVGRWRNELSPSLLRACDEAFAPAMEAFGYA